MPLKRAKGKSKKAINTAVSANVKEMHKGPRYAKMVKEKGKGVADKMAVAAAERAARGRK